MTTPDPATTTTIEPHDDATICSRPHPRGTLRELGAWRRGAAEIAARA